MISGVTTSGRSRAAHEEGQRRDPASARSSSSDREVGAWVRRPRGAEDEWIVPCLRVQPKVAKVGDSGVTDMGYIWPIR